MDSLIQPNDIYDFTNTCIIYTWLHSGKML